MRANRLLRATTRSHAASRRFLSTKHDGGSAGPAQLTDGSNGSQGSSVLGMVTTFTAVAGAAAGYYLYSADEATRSQVIENYVPSSLRNYIPGEAEKAAQKAAAAKEKAAKEAAAAAAAKKAQQQEEERKKREAAEKAAKAKAEAAAAAAAEEAARLETEAAEKRAAEEAALAAEREEANAEAQAQQVAQQLSSIEQTEAQLAVIAEGHDDGQQQTTTEGEGEQGQESNSTNGSKAHTAADSNGSVSAVAVVAAAPAPAVALEEAKVASAALLARQMGEVLRKDAESSVQAEVAGLAQQELRERVLQLSNELQTRAKWEALRLTEFIAQNDDHWAQRFEEYSHAVRNVADKEVDAERAKLSAASESELAAAKDALAKASKVALEKEKKLFEEKMTAEAEAQVSAIRAQLFDRVAQETSARLSDLTNMQSRVGAVSQRFAERAAYEKESRTAHRLSGAVFGLQNALERRAPATQEVAALKVAGGSDPVLAVALAMLPDEVHSASGIPTRAQLQGSFRDISKKARRAALTPTGASGVISQALGAAKSMLVLPSPASGSSVADLEKPVSTGPSLLDKAKDTFVSVKSTVMDLAAKMNLGGGRGNQGHADAARADTPAATPSSENLSAVSTQLAVHANKVLDRAKEIAEAANVKSADIQRINAIFDSAEAAVAAGDLRAAVQDLQKLEAQALPAEAVNEWVRNAQLRMQADRAARLARARAVILTASLY